MSRAIKLKDNDYIDSTGVTHNRKQLSDILSSFGKYQMSSRSALTYSTTSSWKWKSVANTITVANAGVYLCLYVAWIGTALGTEMDLRFTVNGSIQGGSGNALGNKGVAFDIFTLNVGDVVGVSMQTSGTGSTTIYDPNLIIVKLGY